MSTQRPRHKHVSSEAASPVESSLIKTQIFYLNTHCWISSFLCVFNNSLKICLEMPSTKREQNKFYLTQKRKLKEFDKNLINKKSNLMKWNAEHIL